METLDKIAEKASELFLKYGIRSVTMDDIATHVGMAKKTIYKFFENKNALVKNFITKETETNINTCNLLASKNDDPIITLFFTMLYARKFYLKLSPSIICQLEKDYHSSYMILKQYKDEFLFKSIKQNIEKGIAQDLYQNDFNVDPMSRFFLESLTIIPDDNSLTIKQLITNDQEDIIGHLISGIATVKGLDKINWHKNQHRFTSFVQTLERPFWDD